MLWKSYDICIIITLDKIRNINPWKIKDIADFQNALEILINAVEELAQENAKDLCIKRTHANKDQLLLVLDFPDLPLHNNAAELGARKVVRKRDISLHTWTDWGTELRDAFLSIIETARKLNVPVYNYINDRITGQHMLPSLAELVTANSS